MGTWEKFCLDEVVAFILADEEKRIIDEQKAEAEKEREGQGTPAQKSTKKKEPDLLSLFNDPRYMED